MNFSYEECFFIFTLSVITYFLLLKQKQIKQLKKENHILKQYFKAIEVGNIVTKTNLEANIIYVNDKFCETTLYSRDEILGKSYNL